MPRARMRMAALAGAAALLAAPGVAAAQILPLPPLNPRPQPQPQPQPKPQPAPTKPDPPSPPPGSVSISVNRYDLTVGQELVVTGQVTGRNRNAGQRVELHAEVPKAYKKLGGIVGLDDTSSSGRFRFTVTPSVNTRYTVTVIEPTAQSETRRVYVYPRKSTEVDSIGGGRLVRINLYEAGAIYKPLVGARWAYFYARAYGARTWHRIGRGRLRPCCPGEDTGFVRAVKVVSLRRLPARGYVSGCTKTTAIRGLGRGAPYSACGRRTLRD